MEIPAPILKNLEACGSEADLILQEARNLITDFDPSTVSLQISSVTCLPLMTFEEQSQSLAFIVRYEHLPELNSFEASAHPNGNHYLKEIDQIRAALNEYRTIFFNQDDGISYGRIANLYQKAFRTDLPKATMRIRALNSSNEDVSPQYLEHLNSRRKAIRHAVEKSDFSFIFNGVLQHSDSRHAFRMVKAYTDGTLAYLLLKNLFIAQELKVFLSEHYRVINALNFPKMGPL